MGTLWSNDVETMVLLVFYNPPTKIIETTAKNSVVPVATSNVKLFLKTLVRLKIMSLYIYKDLKLKDLRWSNESRDHYHEDGQHNVVFGAELLFSIEA